MNHRGISTIALVSAMTVGTIVAVATSRAVNQFFAASQAMEQKAQMQFELISLKRLLVRQIQQHPAQEVSNLPNCSGLRVIRTDRAGTEHHHDYFTRCVGTAIESGPIISGTPLCKTGHAELVYSVDGKQIQVFSEPISYLCAQQNGSGVVVKTGVLNQSPANKLWAHLKSEFESKRVELVGVQFYDNRE